jgi:hypothetical protein
MYNTLCKEQDSNWIQLQLWVSHQDPKRQNNINVKFHVMKLDELSVGQEASPRAWKFFRRGQRRKI